MISSNTIPLFVTGKTKEELITNMWAINSKYSCQMQYFDIQFVNNEWVAWYFFDATKVTNDKKQK